MAGVDEKTVESDEFVGFLGEKMACCECDDRIRGHVVGGRLYVVFITDSDQIFKVRLYDRTGG